MGDPSEDVIENRGECNVNMDALAPTASHSKVVMENILRPSFVGGV
jgi:hypothetical protein